MRKITFFILIIFLITQNNSAEAKVSVKSIFGSDDRKLIKNTSLKPYSSIGYLVSKFDYGDMDCTATIIARDKAITAAHCLYNKKVKMKYKEAHITPALNNSMSPYGSFKISKAYIHPKYTQKGDSNYDIAILKITPISGMNIGEIVPQQYIEYKENILNEDIKIIGYPSEMQNDFSKTQWESNDKIIDYQENKLKYKLDTTQGQSGSPIMLKNSNNIIGIHTTGTINENYGVRVNKELHLWITQQLSR